MDQNSWGKYTECPVGAVGGLCTSGGNKDCKGNAHSIYCNTAMKVDREKCEYVHQTDWWTTAKCPPDYVVIGRGASGGNIDAKAPDNGKKYPTVMRCCKAITSIKEIVN